MQLRTAALAVFVAAFVGMTGSATAPAAAVGATKATTVASATTTDGTTAAPSTTAGPARGTTAAPASAPAVPSLLHAAAADFPPAYAGYHTYAEMVTEIMATQAAHPDIVRISSIGKSYQGRDIWVAKISDNVGTDENEPEVMFDGLTHAREHISLEQTLAILRWLSSGYGTDPRVTSMVNTREIWIVFAVNPDGAEYDLTGSPFRNWRKNRQPNAGSTHVGTDINRNYGYHWGCCGGSSGSAASLTYRGPSAFSTPEARVIRDFMASRRINGRQQIRLAITFHSAGQQVLWPYGYTKTNVPYDMTVDDQAALASMGKAMAKLNGYKPMQSSDLYVTDGDEIDWAYGHERIWMYTVELYPTSGFYPPASILNRETLRNREAIYYLIEHSWCPWAVIGKATANCGPAFDDFESSTPWTTNPLGTDTATGGAWERAAPAATAYQSRTVPSGSRALVTGRLAGATVNSYDVDGTTSVRGPLVQLGATTGSLTFRYYFAHGANSSSADSFRAYVEREDGSRTLVKRELGSAKVDKPVWSTVSVPLARWAGQKIRIVFVASDVASGSTVEAAVDDVRITRP